MTTVVQTSYPQGYPAQQNPAYPPAYPQTGYPTQQAIQIPATTTTTTNTNSSVSNKYNKKAGVVTGTLQLVAAGLLVILGIIALILGTFYRSGWNIWGSLCFYMVSGILGVVSKNQNKCVIIAYMVMSILSAVCSGGQVLYDSVAASLYAGYASYGCGSIDYYNSYNFHYVEDSHCQHAGLLSAMHALAAVTGFCEMIIAIVAASYCCCGMCGTTPSQTTVVTLNHQPAPGTTYLAPASAPYQPQGQYYPQAPPPNYAPQQPQAQAPANEEPK